MDPRHGRPARIPDPTSFASHELRRRMRSQRRMPHALRAARGGHASHHSLYDGAEPDSPFGQPLDRARNRAGFPRSRRTAWDGGPWPRLFDAAEPNGERRSGVERRSGKDRRSGPFPGGRRATDRQPPDAAAAGWRSRAREFLRRFRDPLIGLTIAGAAAPLATAVTTAPKAGKQPPQPRPERRAALAARGGREPGEDIEVAPVPSDAERNAAVERAMRRYDIPRDLAEDIYDHAVEAGIDPQLAYGLVKTESNFDHRAVSHVGARGLTQLMPATARWLMPGITSEDLFDREINLRLGFNYLRDLIDQYDGNVRLALLAYNRGPGTVNRVLARGGDPNNGYADMVLSG